MRSVVSLPPVQIGLINESVISPNTADCPKNINIITQRSNNINFIPVPSLKLVYRFTTTITVPRNNLRTKSRPRAHARNVVTTITNFKDKFSPLSTLFISNSRLLLSKTDELASTVIIYSVEVAVITETWLSADGPRTATDLPGYSLVRHDIASALMLRISYS